MNADNGAIANDRRATVVLTGDVMLGRLVDRELTGKPPGWAWSDLRSELSDADLTLINLESPIAEGGSPWLETHRVFHFRAGPHAVDVLTSAGVDCVNMANNHALDYGRDALVETLDRLDDAGIAHVGAGRDLAEAARPVVLERRGIRIGILGVCDDPPEYAAAPDSPGTHRVDVDEAGLNYLHERIAPLRDRCDVVILSIHWGPNMRLEPPQSFRRFARSLIDAGVMLFHGHSAHVFQGIEWRGRRAILYDTGDFLDDYAVDPDLRNDWGLLYRAVVAPGRVESLEALPVQLELARTRSARDSEAEGIRDRLQTLCDSLDSRVLDGPPPWRIVPRS